MSRLFQTSYISIFLTILFVYAGWFDGTRPSVNAEEPVEFYLQNVKPLLRAKCTSCHGALKQESELRLDSAEFIKAGSENGSVLDLKSVNDSTLLSRISSHDESERMPPEGKRLTKPQIELIRQWIENGAIGPKDERVQKDPTEHWAFQKLKKASPPNRLEHPSDHPVDAFIKQKLTQHRLSLSKPATATALIRRMFLDLHGLPPTPEDLNKWKPRIAGPKNSLNQKAIASLVDALLESPRYGERWAQHWLDVVRFADTHGFEVNTPRPNAWHYRDYVIKAFNNDLPYNKFIMHQLAGDAFDQDTATGFLVAAPVLLPGQIGADDVSKRLARQDSLDEIIVGTSATFLGLTIGCARCHDHKFDPISQKDYYSFQAFFAGVEYGDRKIRDADAQRKKAKSQKLVQEINGLTQRLSKFEPLAHSDDTIIVDDEDLVHVTILEKKNGHGTNPNGTKRGYKNDVGDSARIANISKHRYTWWDNKPGVDVFTWNPNATGKYQLWISWGVHGSGVHTRDARYVFDADGDLSTVDDQKELASADQYYFAGESTGETEKVPMWSGLRNIGTFVWKPDSKLILRGGKTGTGITADVIVLQKPTKDTKRANASKPNQFDSIQQSAKPHLRSPVSFSRNIERFSPIDAKFIRFTTFATTNNNRYEPCIDELEIFSTNGKNVAVEKPVKLSSSGNYSETGIHQLKHINDGKYGNSHSWISNQKGNGWVQLELARNHRIERIEWARDRTGKFKDRLATNYSLETSLDGKNWTLVAGSQDRMPIGTTFDKAQNLARTNGGEVSEITKLASEIKELRQQKSVLDTPQMAYAGKFKKPDETFLLNRGNPEQKLEMVSARVPKIFAAQNEFEKATSSQKFSAEQSRRIGLANWIADSNNPLTARVMVNRIWQYHFGVGLVDTPSDFGLNGSQPSHAELLDYLAQKFIDKRWSVKELHRLIMSSNTYQQSSKIREDAKVIDGDSRLLWRFPTRRIEGEAIRDSILQISGKLNLKMGGTGFNFFKTRGGLSGFPVLEKLTANEFRRMIYAHKIRMEPAPVFGVFDCPDAGQPMPKRSQSTTPLQALNLFNSEFIQDRSLDFAKRLEKLFPNSIESQVQSCFEFTLGRKPSAAELAAAKEMVTSHQLDALCRALFNSNEFLFMP